MSAELLLKNYLWDVGDYIKTRALEAKQEREQYRQETSDYDYQSGRVMAFNEVISILQQTAEGMNIPLSALQLDDFDPDQELV